MPGKFGIDDVEVGPANAAGAYLDANFSIAGDRVCALLQLQRHSRRRQYHRTHLLLPKEPAWRTG